MSSVKSHLLLLLLCLSILCGGEEVCESEASCESPSSNSSSRSRVKSNREAWDGLKRSLARIREACGEVCDTRKTGTPGKYYEFIQKEVDCR